MKRKIAAIVVTYNRKQLLKECLEAVRRQTYDLSTIYIVDNASTDSTPELLLESKYISELPISKTPVNQIITEKVLSLNGSRNWIDIKYIRKNLNDGGAGGFHEGIKQAYQNGEEYFWLMDDDVIPENNALHELLLVSEKLFNYGFLCSKVVGINNEVMNVPTINLKDKNSNMYPKWGEHLHDSLINVTSATFVSILIPRLTIRKYGLPIKKMFIWGDDKEYTMRISQFMDCYLVGKSIVLHKRKNQKAISISNESDKKRIKMLFYFYRNSIYIQKTYYGFIKTLVLLLQYFITSIKCLLKLKISFSFTIIKGIISGLLWRKNNKIIEKTEI